MVKTNEKGATIVEEVIIIPVFLLIILIIINITFWHIGTTASNRFIVTTQAELQNSFHVDKLFDETETYDNRLESVLNLVEVNAGLLNPKEVRILATGYNPKEIPDSLNFSNYGITDQYDNTILALKNKTCEDENIECITYEFTNNNFSRIDDASGIISTCDDNDNILFKIEYDYTIDNVIFGNQQTQTLTAETINKCG